MPYVPKRAPLDPCPVEAVLSLVAGKWKARILLALAIGRLTFAELRRVLPGVSQQVLTAQLRALERDGIVRRTAVGADPLAESHYALTDEGSSLLPILGPVADWGVERLSRQGLAWTRPVTPAPRPEARFGPYLEDDGIDYGHGRTPTCPVEIKQAHNQRCRRHGVAMRTYALLVMLALHGCSPSEDQVRVDAALTAVREQLRDPEAAQFRKVRIVGAVVCGEVNTRNGFGGYTGYRDFVVTSDVATVAPQDDPLEQIKFKNRVWSRQGCLSAGEEVEVP